MTDREPRRVSRRWIDAWEKCEWPDEDGRTEREPMQIPWGKVAVAVALLAFLVPLLLSVAIESHMPLREDAAEICDDAWLLYDMDECLEDFAE